MSSFGKAQQPCHSNVGMLSAHVIPALAGVEAGIYGQKARPCCRSFLKASSLQKSGDDVLGH